MKKLSLYIVVVTALLTGCTKTYDDTINGEPADTRIGNALTVLQNKLTKAPNGWIMIETTTGTAFNQGVSESGPVATFSYFVEFNDSNKVKMFSDFDTSMAAVPKTSDYRIKELTRPALIFDTYTYLHVPSDPDPNVSKSPFGVGYGWGTDFEFTFSENVNPETLGDTIRLTGNLNGAKLVLMKATKAQRDAYYAGGLRATIVAWGNIQNYFKRVTSGSTAFEMVPGLGGAKSININTLDGAGNLKSVASNVYYTATSVNLTTPVAVGTLTVSRFDNIVWNAGTSTITTSINGTTAATITGSIAPLKNDVNAPRAWWNKAVNNGDSYWVTVTNFHINGVDDALKVASIPGYYGFSVFWPRFDVFQGVNFDLLSPITTGATGPAIAFGAGYRPPNFTAGGTVIFPLYVSIGTVPPAANTIFTNYRNKFADPSGYYLVLKEDGTTYDMVSVSDAKSWIQWLWIY